MIFNVLQSYLEARFGCLFFRGDIFWSTGAKAFKQIIFVVWRMHYPKAGDVTACPQQFEVREISFPCVAMWSTIGANWEHFKKPPLVHNKTALTNTTTLLR